MNEEQSQWSNLSERFVQLSQDALLVEHLSLVTVLVVVVDPLPHVRRQLVKGHVLLHLFVLRGHTDAKTMRLLSGHKTGD